MEIPRVPWHDEEDHSIGSIRVVIVDQGSNQTDYSVILGESPKGGGGGRRGERKKGKNVCGRERH